MKSAFFASWQPLDITWGIVPIAFRFGFVINANISFKIDNIRLNINRATV